MIEGPIATPTSDVIADVFAPIIGLPCWNVRKGYGSFLTLDFGKPYLVIREPLPPLADASPAVRRMRARRSVHVRGDWHLWIYCCNWRVLQAGIERCWSESSDMEIVSALASLEGQNLISVESDASKGTSCFLFDLGGSLETWPYTRETEPSWAGDEEQWLLYMPEGRVFSFCGNGTIRWSTNDET